MEFGDQGTWAPTYADVHGSLKAALAEAAR